MLENKKIVILTEGGFTFGFGHITRSKSIAQSFNKFEIQSTFIINGDASITDILNPFPYIIFDWTKETDRLLGLLKNIDLILIDSIEISDELIKKLERLNIKIAFIDDYKRKNILDTGIVIDWTVLSDEKDYFLPKKAGVTYILGSKYASLREEFWNAKQNVIKKDISSIMVTFGGSDVKNLTPRILNILASSYPNIQKNIVIGAGFQNILQIDKIKDKNTNLIFNANAKTMLKLMQDNDIAIASGGQTLYELALVGTPTVAILLVENAKDDTEGWSKVGSIKSLGWWNDEDIFDNLILTIDAMKDKKVRSKMQDSAKNYIFSNGGKMLVEKIMENL
jgi:spore coat polysaccharide biosynthesis predicted glycosyltransferase SpsG